MDELLPPGVSSSAATSPTPTADTATPTQLPPNAPQTAEGTVAIPSEDGGYVTVREKTKTVEFHGEEVEVRRLTPEEKQRKRLIKNIIMACLGILFLSVVTLVLVMLT